MYREYQSEQDDACVLTGLNGGGVPQGGLHLTHMALAQQEHRHAGLTDAAAHGLGELAVQQEGVEGEAGR